MVLDGGGGGQKLQYVNGPLAYTLFVLFFQDTPLRGRTRPPAQKESISFTHATAA